MLLHLPDLRRFSIGCAAPLVISRLSALLEERRPAARPLALRQLALGRDEQLEVAELEDIADMCPQLQELTGLSVAVLNDR